MIYIISSIFLLILLSYSNFLSLRFKIKLNESFLVSVSLILLLGYSYFYFHLEYSKLYLEYIFFVILVIALLMLPYLAKNNFKINKKLNLEFILFFILIFLLSKDRYYLDQDEITYWGRAVKALFLNLDETIFNHHPQGLNIFRYLFVFYNFNEGMTIFSNNIILISGFYYLFYERNLHLFEKILLYLIYYLLLNNLSFGFLSIYSDPILAILYSCLLKKLFYLFKDEDLKFELNHILNFLIILISLLLINRSSVIYIIFTIYISISLFLLTRYKRDNSNFNYYPIIIYPLIIIFLSIAIYEVFIPNILSGFYGLEEIFVGIKTLFSSDIFINKFYSFMISPIYFSQFGSTLNGILEIIFASNFRLYEFQIPLITYIVLLLPFLLFDFKFKLFIFISTICEIIIYAIIILILKNQLEKISLLALPRYLGIMILAKYFFIISLIILNNKSINKNYVFIFLLIFLVSVTPKKTLGFFVTDEIYYKSASNKKFRNNRDKISKLKKIKNDFDHVLIVHHPKFSDYSNNLVSGEHTFYNDLIIYELFPKEAKFIKFNDYLKYEKVLNSIIEKNLLNIDMLVILYDLSKNQMERINYIGTTYEIETYQKK